MQVAVSCSVFELAGDLRSDGGDWLRFGLGDRSRLDRCVVARGDLPPREPAFAGRGDGRDQASAGPDDPGAAADRVRAADQVKDGVGTVGVRSAQRHPAHTGR